MKILRHYYSLTKPGIVFGNSITALAGGLLATKGSLDFPLLSITLVGLGLIVAAGCVLNNFLDRLSDQLMPRTRRRPLAIKAISEKRALYFGFVLLFLGGSILAFFTNLLATCIALIGFVIYVLFYSLLKHKTVYGTEIGSIAGAVPPVAGYCAISHSFDFAAFLLFAIVICWQMPHFFAIAMYRIEEYRAASIPVLPIVRGAEATKIQMLVYVAGFVVLISLLTAFGFVGYCYLVVASFLALMWLKLAIQGFRTDKDKVWARKMFQRSLLVIIGLCIMIAVDRV